MGLMVLLERNRINLLTTVIDSYLELIYQTASIKMIEVSTASAFTNLQKDTLIQKLKELTNAREIRLVINFDSSLIGGFLNNTMINIRPDEISSIIREQIEQYDQDVKVDNIGTVLQVGDGIARVYGLDQVMCGELLEFEDKTIGIALNLENDNVGVVLMGTGRQILEGGTVKSTGQIAQIP